MNIITAFSIECEIDRNKANENGFKVIPKSENTEFGKMDYIELKRNEKSCIVFENCGMNNRRSLDKCSIPLFAILEKEKIRNLFLLGFAGSTNKKHSTGSFLIASDFIDLTKSRPRSFLELRHPGKIFFYRMAEPYSTYLSAKLKDHAKKNSVSVFDNIKYAITEGPRFESAAEIGIIKNAGCDAVCLSGIPEVYFSRELGINFCVGLFVSNMAEGIDHISNAEILNHAKDDGIKITEIICNMASDDSMHTDMPYYGDKYWMQKP